MTPDALEAREAKFYLVAAAGLTPQHSRFGILYSESEHRAALAALRGQATGLGRGHKTPCRKCGVECNNLACHRRDVVDDSADDDEPLLCAEAVVGLWCALEACPAEAGSMDMQSNRLGDEPFTILGPP